MGCLSLSSLNLQYRMCPHFFFLSLHNLEALNTILFQFRFVCFFMIRLRLNASLEKNITEVMYLQDILSVVQDFGLSHLG